MEIVRLEPDQVGEAAAVLARAFQDDPAWSWVLPNARRRAALLPWLFRIGFERHRGRGLDDRRARIARLRALAAARAAAVRVGPTLRALVATPLRVREATSRFLAYGRAVEAMRAAAVPEPHWYLAGHRRRAGRAAHAASAPR